MGVFLGGTTVCSPFTDLTFQLASTCNQRLTATENIIRSKLSLSLTCSLGYAFVHLSPMLQINSIYRSSVTSGTASVLKSMGMLTASVPTIQNILTYITTHLFVIFYTIAPSAHSDNANRLVFRCEVFKSRPF